MEEADEKQPARRVGVQRPILYFDEISGKIRVATKYKAEVGHPGLLRAIEFFEIPRAQFDEVLREVRKADRRLKYKG